MILARLAAGVAVAVLLASCGNDPQPPQRPPGAAVTATPAPAPTATPRPPLRRRLEAQVRDDESVQELLDEVVARRLDPASAAAKLLERE